MWLPYFCFKQTKNIKDGAMELLFTIIASVLFQVSFCFFCFYLKQYKSA